MRVVYRELVEFYNDAGELITDYEHHSADVTDTLRPEWITEAEENDNYNELGEAAVGAYHYGT